jgi:hypothetical protein
MSDAFGGRRLGDTARHALSSIDGHLGPDMIRDVPCMYEQTKACLPTLHVAFRTLISNHEVEYLIILPKLRTHIIHKPRIACEHG